MRFTKPGLYFGVPSADYFADCCPEPSLTQSFAKLLISRSPWHVKSKHPRLSPDFVADEPTKFDLGNAAHWHLIGRGKDMVPVEAATWQTKAAREERQKLIAAGKCPVLRAQFDRAGDMAEAALEQLQKISKRLGLPFIDDWRPDAGDGEVVAIARTGDVWLRTLIDWLPNHRQRVYDYKSTLASAAPQELDRKMADDGWIIQSAMQERILDLLDPDSMGRRSHYFLCQECDPPYALSVSRMSESALTMGRKMLDHAIKQWRRCMQTGYWPGYDEIAHPELPPWVETKWLDREMLMDEARQREPMLTDLRGG